MASTKSLHYYTVDAFTALPFAGNQCAVIVLPAGTPWPEDSFLLKIAAEFNYAETAYILKAKDSKPNEYGLRWFTPVKEVRLCGHATLGSAHALRSHPQLLASQDPTLVFNTLSGALTVDISSPDKLLMDFPADAIVELPGTLSLAKVSAAIDVSRQDIANVTVSEQNGYIVIEVTEFVDIESLNVDSAALAQLFPGNLAQTVTNFKSGILFCRVFATAAGIPEDPVTGSMYTVLGPYWKAKTGNSTFRARQCSKRGGDVQVEVKDNGRVIVGGQAVNVMEGDLFY